jgi:RNA polymerase sigma factor (TIGR02999 family)
LLVSDVTQFLQAANSGDAAAERRLLELIYDELRSLAAHRMAREQSGRTLQITALVHEAYLRLFKNASQQPWNSRGHFFSAASEVMRRILIDQSRRRLAAKRGGTATREELSESRIEIQMPDEEILALHEALEQFAAVDAAAAQLVQLRFFGGLNMSDAAETLGISERSAYDLWAYARSWLKDKLRDE